MTTLISKASTGKLKLVILDYECTDNIYRIFKKTGYYEGKLIDQPTTIISEGKAKRTVQQQFELVYSHLIKAKLDQGYIQLENPLDSYTKEELVELVGKEVKGINGIPKPMLAKSESQITDRSIFETRTYMASRKIDGLRCLFYWDGTEVRTASRGGMDYDAATIELRHHPTMIAIFQERPKLILDTELYKHGLSLQEINQIARKSKKAVDTSILQIYWYDVIEPDIYFFFRNELMQQIAKKYKIGFDPSKDFGPDELRIQLVPHEEVTGFYNIMDLHDKYVSEGFEGCVIREKFSLYKPNGRTNDWIKIKKYQDLEAKVIGYELGARGSEDMCFKCQLDNGIEFMAKAYGDRVQKEWYYNHFEDYCLGHMATVKYFYFSDDGVPLQPGVKSIRIKEDLG